MRCAGLRGRPGSKAHKKRQDILFLQQLSYLHVCDLGSTHQSSLPTMPGSIFDRKNQKTNGKQNTLSQSGMRVRGDGATNGEEPGTSLGSDGGFDALLMLKNFDRLTLAMNKLFGH